MVIVNINRGNMYSPFEDESPLHCSDSSSSEVPSPPPHVPVYTNMSSDSNNDGQPYLKILEQPQSRFRFRYKSEMVGTHGQLKAERANKNRPIYPTVQLCNWNKGPAIIRLLLFTAENGSRRKKHVHELSGKNCNKETGICEFTVDESTDYTAKFQNLGVIHIAKRDAKGIIFERLKEDMITHAMWRKGNQTREQIIAQIQKSDTDEMDRQAEEDARTMDLNKIVLRFQALQYDNNTNSHRYITKYVDSDPVMNLKNASTGELKIVRMSECAAPCSGGTEVWMLVEKVRKSNINIKFYEEGNDEKEIWSAYGQFTDVDVHHQYAIVFKTPPYKVSNLNAPVRVKVLLERPSDKDTSEPREFTYLPEKSRKRPSQYQELQLDDSEDYQISSMQSAKRVCTGYSEPLNLAYFKQSPNSPNGTVENEPLTKVPEPFFLQPPTSPQSPHFMVPCPIVSSADVSNHHIVYPSMKNIVQTPTIALQTPIAEHQIYQPPVSNAEYSQQMVFSTGNNEMPLGSPQQCQLQGQYNLSPIQQQDSPQYHEVHSPGRVVPSSPGMIDSKSLINNLLLDTQQHYGQPNHQVPLIQHQNQQDSNSNDFMTNQQPSFLIQNSNSCVMQHNYSNNLQDPSDFLDFDSLLNGSNNLVTVDMAQMNDIFNSNFGGSSDLKTDYSGSKKEISSNNKKDLSIDELTKKMSKVKVEENTDTENKTAKSEAETSELKKLSMKEGNIDVAFRVAIRAAECLQLYAATGDIGVLLDNNKYLLAVQNNKGFNSLHTAVANRNWQAFNKIMKACEKIKPQQLINACNTSNETALHLAMRVNESGMVERLVSTPGCDIGIPNIDGNTPVHIAAALPHHQCLHALLSVRPINGMCDSITQAVNSYNYNGETPLHIASIRGNIENVKILIKAKASEHACERKRGANSLHLATMFNQISVAKYLIDNTGITVDGGMFDGNTPLHLAVLAKNIEMCKILINAKADPHSKNLLHRRKKLSESDDEDEEESEDAKTTSESEDAKTTSESDDAKTTSETTENKETETSDDYYSPLDYSEDNVEIKAVLLGQVVQSNIVESKFDVEGNSSVIDSGIDISSDYLITK